MFEKEATRIYDADGKLFATLGTEKRESITYEKLPQVLVDAIIARRESIEKMAVALGGERDCFVKRQIIIDKNL